LQQVEIEALLSICEENTIAISDAKKTKKTAVANAVIRYLTSEQLEDMDDEGMSVLKKVDEILRRDRRGGDRRTTTAMDMSSSSRHSEVKTEDSPEKKTTITKVEFSKLREFKIIGGMVGGTGENALDYMSLCHQMAEGRELGFTQREVRNGVVRAIKAGSALRKYFERNSKITDLKFIKMLRQYYEMKDSSTLLSEMDKCFQEPKEKEKDFVLRLMAMRDDIVALSLEEEYPKELREVHMRMLHIISVGLRKDTVRIELQGVLKDELMSDEDLLDELRKVVARDTEHRSKVKSGGQADVHTLGAAEGVGSKPSTQSQTEMEKKVLAELSKVSAQVSELAVVKEEIKELKDWARCREGERQRELNNNSKKGNWKFVKCENCAKTNQFCKHCTICKKEGHKRYECPDAPEKNL
jgi:hypothetical protein